MQRAIVLAAIALVLQIGLVIAIYSGDQGYEPFAPDEKVVSFAVDSVDTIIIQTEDGEMQIRQKNENWVLAGPQGVPADSGRVEQFLRSISGFKRSLAVATSKEAAERFKVAEDSYVSHLTLKQGETELADLYFGTSPAFKQTHMRVAGSDEIIIVGFGSHEVSAEINQWIDKNLLAIEKARVQQISLPQASFIRTQEAGWQAQTGEEQAAGDAAEVDVLLEKINELSVSGYSPQSDTADTGDSFAITLTFDDGETIEYRFAQLEENSYGVSRSDLSYRPTVSAWQVDALVEQIDKLTPEAETGAEAEKQAEKQAESEAEAEEQQQ